MKIFVQKIRIEKDLSINELARKSGVAASHIYNIENEMKSPTIEILCKIAKALNVPCCELFSCGD